MTNPILQGGMGNMRLPGRALDPVTLEVLQNKLRQITYEAGVTMQRTAASPVIVEAKDIGFNITDEKTRTIIYSAWIPRHGTTTTLLIRSVINKLGRDPGIFPGDQVMVNNPYDGALHQPDVCVVAPIHYGDELVGWSGCATHHLDIGAAAAGHFPRATDWFSEGLKIPPVKIVEAGKLRRDVFDLFLLNVRVPAYQALDLTAQIAANNTARSKLLQLVERYGLATLRACYDEMILFTEEKVRSRIRSLPEGIFEFSNYIDYHGIYLLKCLLTIKNGEMTFDFTGSAPQAPSLINCTLGVTMALVHNMVFCMLIPDVEANEGALRPLKVIAPEGTIVNCRPPVACSGASTAAAWRVQDLVMGALNQALINTGFPERSRVSAAWGEGIALTTFHGRDAAGRTFFMNQMYGTMQGGGARIDKDGEHVTNIAASTTSSIPDVETSEQRYPVLVLKRGLRQDSEGPGKFRGGLAGEVCLKPHKALDFEAVTPYLGKFIPAWGASGGYPGSATEVIIKRDTDVNRQLRSRVPSFGEIAGKAFSLAEDELTQKMEDSDVIYAGMPGGGGYGDPLDRDPRAVARDVAEGVVSIEKAHQAYGVTVDPETLEVRASETGELRTRLKQQRLTGGGRDSPLP